MTAAKMAVMIAARFTADQVARLRHDTIVRVAERPPAVIHAGFAHSPAGTQIARPAATMRTKTFTFEMLSLLVATAAGAAACGGKAVDDASPEEAPANGTSSGDARGGETNTGRRPSASSSSGSGGFDVPTDCGPLQTTSAPLDENRCEPQIVSQTTYHPASTCAGRVCAWQVAVPCGADGGAPDGGDASTPADWCREICQKTNPGASNLGTFFNCNPYTQDDVTYVSCGGCGVGRPPSGFVAAVVDAPTEEGAWLATMAQLEAASVEAFAALHDDLARHGAPDSLLRLVRIAAEDEVRHARLAREQAESRGAIVPEVHVEVARGRSLVELALDNAREGCIEETFGAVLARIQAERAVDPDLRDMLEGIARDELGHAFLSWRIAEWLDARIADDARERVREARAQKLAELDREIPPEARAALDAIAPALA